jgi:hypothetical protein
MLLCLYHNISEKFFQFRFNVYFILPIAFQGNVTEVQREIYKTIRETIHLNSIPGMAESTIDGGKTLKLNCTYYYEVKSRPPALLAACSTPIIFS